MLHLKKYLSLILALAMLLGLAMVSSDALADDKVELRFMWWGSDARHEATLAVIKQYTDAHPNVVIDAEYGGYDGYFEKLSTQLSGGTAADIIQYDVSMVTNLVTIGDVFVDLTDSGIDLSGFSPEFLNSFSYNNGKMIGLPTGINAGSFLINTAVTDAAGIDISAIKTWDDVIAAGEKLHAANPEQYFLNYELITLGKEFIFTTLAQITGKEILDANMELAFTEQDLATVLGLIDRMYKSGTLQPAAEASVYDTAPWTNPKWISHDFAAASMITSFVNKSNYDFQDTADVIPQPAFADAKESGVILRPTQLIGIASTSKHADVAADFLNYFYNDEEAARTLKDVRSIPPTEMARDLCANEGLLDPMAVKAVDLALPISSMNQNLAVQAQLIEVFKDAAAKVAYAQGTPESVAAETIALLNNALKQLKSN